MAFYRLKLPSMMLATSSVARPPFVKTSNWTILPSEINILNGKKIHVIQHGQVSGTNKSINRGLLSRFLPAPNDTWNLSKEYRPSFARGYPLGRFYFSAVSSPCGTRPRIDLAGLRSISVRDYSCCKEPRDDKPKSRECADEAREQKVPKDCAQPDDGQKLCQQSERSCPPPAYPEDPGVCKPIPCPDIRDYCTTPVSYKQTLWKLVTLLSLPVLLLVSGFVYTREVENRKQPRPKFVDVAYLRRIIKPFPWGDGKHTLFHNPRLNPISPHGYEVEDPNEQAGDSE